MLYKDYVERKVSNAIRINSAEGYPCVFDNSKGRPLKDYKLYGNSIQDGTPTPESPVEIQSVGDLTTKNLLPYPYANTTLTVNGVTWTDNGDGTITASGTIDNTEAIKALQQKNEEFCYNRIHDREQSLEIQRQLTDAISELSKKIYDMEERQKEVKRAEIKDKIAERYRYFHKKQKWTLKDKESLEGLIKAYEKNDGQNSFVHSDVEPEMYTWEIVDDDYDD